MAVKCKGEAYRKRKQQTKGRRGKKVPSDLGPRKEERRHGPEIKWFVWVP